MTLSTKAREAIKTASAMTIAYGAALYMDFTELKWAGFAVAFVSLATVGQSLNKAALRMAGTLIGVIVALTFIGLFAQSRWLFMVFLSIWPGCCAYMMGGPNNQYLWHVGGFVSVIICMGARRERSGAVSATTRQTLPRRWTNGATASSICRPRAPTHRYPRRRNSLPGWNRASHRLKTCWQIGCPSTVINTLVALVSQQDQLAASQGGVATNLVDAPSAAVGRCGAIRTQDSCCQQRPKTKCGSGPGHGKARCSKP